MDVLDIGYLKKIMKGLGAIKGSPCTIKSTQQVADGVEITFSWIGTDGTEQTETVLFKTPKGDKGDTGVSVDDIKITTTTNGERHLIATLDDGTEKDCGILPNESYDDTQIKQNITDLQTNKVDKVSGKSLVDDTEIVRLGTLDNYDDTNIKASIKTVSDGLMASAGYSADYKKIEIVTKAGDKKEIDVAPIISHAKLTELSDVDDTNIGDEKTIVYDSATQKHKYVDSTGTDELVKMTSSTEAKYLSELIDKGTIVNDGGTLKVKKLDGQEVTISEINYLKGLTMNVMDLVKIFSNGGIKILNTPVSTYADLSTLDRSSFIDGISYIVYVLADETHSGAKTTYLCDKTSETFFGNADSQRDFTTNPINLATEVAGKLDNSHIDVDNLWTLLTIDDTYKTLTTNNKVFGTHGAKALYDELVTAIGKKANTTDLTNHTNDTNIHVTSAERTKWNEVDNKINKASITTSINSSSTDTQVPTAKVIYDNLIKNNIKTYYLLSQLGITTATCTIKNIWDKMPVNSIAIIDTDSSIVTDLDDTRIALNLNNDQYIYGFLTIGKFKERTILEFRRSHEESAIVPETFIGYCIGKNCTSIKWKRMIITSVANIGRTNITLTAPTGMTITAHSNFYEVINGICNVQINNTIKTTTRINFKVVATGLPKPSVSRLGTVANPSGGLPLLYQVDTNGQLIFYIDGAMENAKLFQKDFSYPLAES